MMRRIYLLIVVAAASLALYFGWSTYTQLLKPQSRAFLRWSMGSATSTADLITTQAEPCPGAPFVLPAEGFIGLQYADPRGPYSTSRPHQGIDIFSPDRDKPGLVPVIAAYDGYVTRESDWRSTLIQRVPEDPLQPDRQIWLYYTHMADDSGQDFIEETFAPGTRELFVKQGTLLGYTGNYNGSSARDLWVHLHFSIVKDDGAGRYTNELEFTNSIDSSPYLGMPVNYACGQVAPGCSDDLACAGFPPTG